jgi:hypothetical protein
VSFWQPSLDDPRLLTSRHIVSNLSRPEQPLILLAPLAQSAGGWGLCRDPQTHEPRTLFADMERREAVGCLTVPRAAGGKSAGRRLPSRQ